jgi:hypothetical protein
MSSNIHGDFSSADASALNEANSRISLYDDGGIIAAILGATQSIYITDISFVIGAALTVTIYDGIDTTASSGEIIMKGNYAANGGHDKKFVMPFQCKAGTYPKVKTSGAGQIDVQMRGYIK